MAASQKPIQPSSLTQGFFQSLLILPPQYSSLNSSFTKSPSSLSDDPAISRLIALYLPSPPPAHLTQHLHQFSRVVLSPSVLAHTVDADTNPPTLHPLTTFGTPNLANPLRTSSGWRALKRIETAAGVVARGYPEDTRSSSSPPPSSPQTTQIDGPYNHRIAQFLTLHLWHGSAAVTTCPMAMTDGCAVLLRAQLSSPSSSPPLSATARKTFSDAYARLTSSDPNFAWTSGQWMTERTGGSDVRGTETLARKLSAKEIEDDNEYFGGGGVDGIGNELGQWRVDGFKWFSSATDADCVVLLAKTAVGLSAFWAPMRRRVNRGQGEESLEGSTSSAGAALASAGEVGNDASPPSNTVLNGVHIIRLKSKLGTRAVPTAELEIKGMRAYLLGQEGLGVKLISTILNVTRLWTTSGGVGTWARGLALSRAFTRARNVKGRPLADNALHVKWLADETVEYRGMLGVCMFGVALLGHIENKEASGGTKAVELGLLPDTKAAEKLLRLLTPVMKSRCTVRSVEGLRVCMESLGGVGYCENNEDAGVLNVARLFRDANVDPIWEGTGSVLAEDLCRALRVARKDHMRIELEVFGGWVVRVSGKVVERRKEFGRLVEDVKGRYEKLKTMLETKSEEELLWQGRVVVDHFCVIVTAILLMVDAVVDGDEVAIAVAERYARTKLRQGSVNDNLDFKKETEMDRRIFLGDQENARTKMISKL